MNPEKCCICGLKATGLKPDPVKVNAIRDMPPPTGEAELEAVHAMVNYLDLFPNWRGRVHHSDTC